MSNPGVIKLAGNDVGNHYLWIDDNIGESIHIHFDMFRIELTVDEFKRVSAEFREVLNKLIEFDINTVDERVLYKNMAVWSEVKGIREEKVRLSQLKVIDDDGPCCLPYSDRVAALNGDVDIDLKSYRKTNYYGQTNKDRLLRNLEFVKTHHYPSETGYIFIVEGRNLVVDGWHRAACLYYLNGDIEIEVKVLSLRNNPISVKRILPNLRVAKDSRIVLYGAGDNGINYYKQLRTENYTIVAWWDKNAGAIRRKCDFEITLPFSVEDNYYDLIVISVLDDDRQREIIEQLVKGGVNERKIITA